MWMAFTFTEDVESGWRPHGLMAPPENPFLRDELKPRVYSHWAKWQEQRRARAQQEAGGTAAPLLPPAAAAAASSSASH